MGLMNASDQIIDILIGIVLVFSLASAIIPSAQVAGDNLSNSGIPLGSLFGSTGITFVLVAIALVLFIVRATKVKK